jgi:hypothetical protein
MYKIILLSILCVFSWSKNANAGWYQVNNYVGDIGDAPVHLSLQSYPFGSGTTVEGSYYYDRFKSIIPIYGKYDDGKLKLCEIPKITDEMTMNADSAIKAGECPFTLTISENVAAGFWKKKNATYQVEIKKVASFDDTGDKSVMRVL